MIHTSKMLLTVENLNVFLKAEESENHIEILKNHLALFCTGSGYSRLSFPGQK